MVRDSFIELGNGLYYADKDGKRAESAWIWSDGREEDGYEDGWYYFGANGKAYRRTGGFKKVIHGNTYVFD